MLSRPNDIGAPLERMAPIWKAVDSFPISDAIWKPYWSNGVFPESSKVKVSYYEALQGSKKRFLVFISNPTDTKAESVEVKISDKPVKIFSVFKQANVSSVLDFSPRGCDVLLIEEI
jgi:hypothetical protein